MNGPQARGRYLAVYVQYVAASGVPGCHSNMENGVQKSLLEAPKELPNTMRGHFRADIRYCGYAMPVLGERSGYCNDRGHGDTMVDAARRRLKPDQLGLSTGWNVLGFDPTYLNKAQIGRIEPS